MESDDELLSLSNSRHVRRALTVIAVSILMITVAGIGYLRPSLGFGLASQPGPARTDKAFASYQLAAVDFVTPTTGWVVADLQPHDFAVLRTTNAGDTWTRQLQGSAGVIGEYLRFFDLAHGVLVLLGPQSALYRTSDGGSIWSRQAPPQGGEYVWSADFADSNHGWLLTQAPTEGEALLRTEDGGATWVGLGNPVRYSDWAYRIVFANTRDGWLYSQSAGPYAYKSEDGGTTWRRVILPEPPGGWPAAQGGAISNGEFFVAAQPTRGAGVVSTVIGIAPPRGRSPAGGVLLGYPPLSVGAFDGGRAVTYMYADVTPYRYSFIEHANRGRLADSVPVPQFQLSSVDGGLSWAAILAPATYGSVGYVDALNWWWIGSGAGSKTSDGGRTWTQLKTIGVPRPLPGSLQFIDANHGWFGAMAGTRPLLESTEDGGIQWRTILLPPITST